MLNYSGIILKLKMPTLLVSSKQRHYESLLN
jgi:hypothetical protein